MDSGSVRHILACFVLLAGCTWLFIGRLDCLIQCFIVLSFFTHAFGALQNNSSCFCGMGKQEQNLAFRGKVRVEVKGRCLWDLLCSRETWDLGEMCPPFPSHCSASISWWFYRVPLVELTQQWGQSCPPIKSCSTKPHGLAQLSFLFHINSPTLKTLLFWEEFLLLSLSFLLGCS